MYMLLPAAPGLTISYIIVDRVIIIGNCVDLAILPPSSLQLVPVTRIEIFTGNDRRGTVET